MQFDTTYLTEAGRSLATGTLGGLDKIQFTRAVASSHDYSATPVNDLKKLTSLEDVQQTVDYSRIIKKDDTTLTMRVDFPSKDVTTAYSLYTVGFYARPENGDEILYGVLPSSLPDYIAAYDGKSNLNDSFQTDTTVSDADNVLITVSQAGSLNEADLDAIFASKHIATIDDIKANIPDTVIDGSKPADFKEAVTLEKGAVDGDGNAIATAKDVSDGDATTLKAAKAYADTQASDKISKNGRYGAENLVRNSAYMQNYDGWTAGGNGTADDTKFSIFVTPHEFYHSDKDNLIQIVNLNTLTSGSASEVFLVSNSFSVTAGKTMAYSFLGFASANVVHEDVYFIGYKADGTQVPMILQQSINLSYNNLDGRSGTFTVPDDIITGRIRFDNNGSTNGKSAGLFITEVKVAEESVVSPWSPSRLDSVKDNGDGTVTVDGRKFVPADTDHTIPVSEAGVAGPANFAAGTLKVDDLEVLGAKVFSDTEDYKTFAAAHPSAITIVTHDTSTS